MLGWKTEVSVPPLESLNSFLFPRPFLNRVSNVIFEYMRFKLK